MIRNRSILAALSMPRVAVLVAWSAGVVLLTPLILLAGVIALIAAPTVIVTRRTGFRMPARRRPALAPVLFLEPSAAKSSLHSSRAA